MTTLGGKVFITSASGKEDEIGTFAVDSDDQVVMNLNGERWSVPWVLQWATEQRASIRLQPELHVVE